MGSSFQTLIGTVKRTPGAASPPRWEPISNPHRYGQKVCSADAREVRVGFQTLIGTVKRVAENVQNQQENTFQTLIGTVKSDGGLGGLGADVAISNPHRYGQKLRGGQRHLHGRYISNPHRYGQKGWRSCSAGPSLAHFKPS